MLAISFFMDIKRIFNNILKMKFFTQMIKLGINDNLLIWIGFFFNRLKDTADY